MGCNEWLETYVKSNGPTTPKEVYAAGKLIGYTCTQIKEARRALGKSIETIRETPAKWRWSDE